CPGYGEWVSADVARTSLAVGVAAGMRGVPFPSGGDDRLDVGELDLPAELALGLGRIGIERGRIAGAAWALENFYRFAEDFFDGANHFAVRRRFAGAEIVEELRAGRGEFVEHGDVRAAEIVDMNVIAEAGAVGC